MAGFHLYFLRMMSFCLLQQVVTSSLHRSSLWSSMRRREWDSAPPSPRWWFSAGKGWRALSWSGERFYPRWRGLSIGVFFMSEGRVKREPQKGVSFRSVLDCVKLDLDFFGKSDLWRNQKSLLTLHRNSPMPFTPLWAASVWCVVAFLRRCTSKVIA